MTTIKQLPETAEERTIRMLRELGFAVHRNGYLQLTVAIPYFLQDPTQGLYKELYPYVAKRLGYTDCRAIERSIRSAIYDAWARSDPEVWIQYFPDLKRPPSNKLFIATLSEGLK